MPSHDHLLLARSICAQQDPNKAYQYLAGDRDDYPPVTIALAAIIETTERATKLAWDMAAKQMPAFAVGEALRSGRHLK